MNDLGLDQLCITTIRMLAIDAIEKANSGHPGLPLGATPMAYVLWQYFLSHNPQNPRWFNRDRFILSAGHGSAMLYALLHLTGYDLPMDEIKNFRQLSSKTPGHPEFGLTCGVEATTGPLGQGFAMGVGMAIAEQFLAAHFNRPDFSIVDHYTYAIVSDGDLMEGVSAEAASLAGHLRLRKLIYLYDSNRITIEGPTSLTFNEDTARRFEAYGWNVSTVPDGNDIKSIELAITDAQKNVQGPSLIIVHTHIGHGSPKQDMAEVHGSPLGKEAHEQTKHNNHWPLSPDFYIPQEAQSYMHLALDKGEEKEQKWNELYEKYRVCYPELALDMTRILAYELPPHWDQNLPVFTPSSKGMATRTASGKVMNALASKIFNFMGGSADLAPSTQTLLNDYPDFNTQTPHGRNMHFGIREHAMGAIINGMALHGGVIPYGATFLVFSDYMRPALRLAAVMQTRSIFIFTHDSIGLGEDGPTHQPIEHIMSLRLIPGLTVLRPADANETRAAWRVALNSKGPVVLALTRQNVPELDPQCCDIDEGVAKGAYILADSSEKPQIILLATGSEVQLALEARQKLTQQNVQTRVVSMPSWELFQKQSQDYRQRVLPPAIPVLAIEAGITIGWAQYARDAIGINRFGASAPYRRIYQEFGLHTTAIVEKAIGLIQSD